MSNQFISPCYVRNEETGEETLFGYASSVTVDMDETETLWGHPDPLPARKILINIPSEEHIVFDGGNEFDKQVLTRQNDALRERVGRLLDLINSSVDHEVIIGRFNSGTLLKGDLDG